MAEFVEVTPSHSEENLSDMEIDESELDLGEYSHKAFVVVKFTEIEQMMDQHIADVKSIVSVS